MLSNYDVKWETGHLKDKARAAEAENAKELEKQMVELKKSEKVKELEKELETLKRAEKEKEKELEKKLEEVRKRERERYLSLLHTDVLVEEVNARREEKAKKKKAAEEEKDRAKWDRRVDIVMYERNKRRSLERESECGRSAWKRWR
jgi:hypothetical protein